MKALIDTQESVDYLMSLPFSYLMGAHKGALLCKADGEWSGADREASDFVDTIISFRIDQGLTS